LAGLEACRPPGTIADTDQQWGGRVAL